MIEINISVDKNENYFNYFLLGIYTLIDYCSAFSPKSKRATTIAYLEEYDNNYHILPFLRQWSSLKDKLQYCDSIIFHIISIRELLSVLVNLAGSARHKSCPSTILALSILLVRLSLDSYCNSHLFS